MHIEEMVLEHLLGKCHIRKQDGLSAKIIDVLISHYASKSTTVAKLAELIEINERTLRKKCVGYFRQTPTVLLTEARIFHAEHLLKQKLKVSDVWYRVGFSSHSYFSDVFKQRNNMTPQEFAKLYRDKES
jgi:AraC-like DNA-binding protein